MNMKELRNWRIWVIGLLATTALILICSEPISEEKWFATFLFSKILGFVFGYAAYRIIIYWESKGLLPEFNDKEEMI